ncbi:porin [Microbacterium sorbitolivorans]|uniref:OmpA family protein n=1 Tax=Microbacterium sorbitolivorans TaxID=1867410 RepID=A0A367XSZ6_9MICO|nr:OmpA family protein [Microbacterium sorbitolivorans]RCK56753.1 OmpA family protein [Microbacterium sorbitolivorans]GGF50493.1 porin [Microbacterium sorbitolivorans]
MKNSARTRVALLGASLVVLAVAGCSDEPILDPRPATTTPADPTSAGSDAGTDPAPADPDEPADGDEPDPEPTEPAVATVPGYAVGEFPSVPMFVLPDLALFDDDLASDATRELHDDLSGLAGVTVSPAHCGEDGRPEAGIQTSLLYGDKNGNVTAPDGSEASYDTGAGTLTVNGETAKGESDGFGSFSEGDLAIRNYGDGSGSYVDADVSIQIYGNGSGSYVSDGATIQNDGTGAGNYFGGGVKIQNNGDGSGSYSDANVTIQNIGDGTGYVNAEPVEMDPLPPLPALGVFPTLEALQPTESCGTLITVTLGSLFDLDESEVRGDADEIIEAIADVLGDDVPVAAVSAHGDTAADDGLGADRADAVVAALADAGATAKLASEDAGDTRPVAPTVIDGELNPAGVELNRRIEVYIPSFDETPQK